MSIDKISLMTFCDSLVAAGEELWLFWEEGEDERSYDLKCGGKTIEYPRKIIYQLFCLLNSSLPERDPEGCYSWKGSVSYDPVAKLFVGLDEYSSSISKFIKCSIPITIPTTIWFDQVEINYKTYGGSDVKVWVEYQIKNGPYTNIHSSTASTLSDILKRQIREIVDNTADFYQLWNTQVIEKADFKLSGNSLVYQLEQIHYSNFSSQETRVVINLKDS